MALFNMLSLWRYGNDRAGIGNEIGKSDPWFCEGRWLYYFLTEKSLKLTGISLLLNVDHHMLKHKKCQF